MDLNVWPSRLIGRNTSAARCARFASAAYPSNDRERHDLKSAIETLGGKWHESSVGPADIIVGESDDVVVVGVSGTNDAADIWVDTDIASVRIYDASSDNNIAVAAGVSRTLRLHAGFVSRAILSLRAFGNTGVNVGRRELWVTGHSLGGAAAVCASYFRGVHRANIVTFGAPKTIRGGRAPKRDITAVRHLLDPTPILPPIMCRHPKSTPLYVSYEGGLPRSSRTVISRFAAGAYIAIATVRWAGSRMRVCRQGRLFNAPAKYHSMENAYSKFTQHLR